MIQLKTLLPDSATLTQLAVWQSEIIGSYDEQVTLAKKKFTSKNNKKNHTFKDIKEVLTQMCSGAKRCCYCEDSAADEVEHIYPKDIFPEKTFDFDNYLYACGPCNGPKNNKFAIRNPHTPNLDLVDFKKNNPNMLPPIGDALLINPRIENGMNFLMLDLMNTFHFVAIPTADVIRANYTEALLGLNRAFLAEARQEAYTDYKGRLIQYGICKKKSDNTANLQQMQLNLLKKQHPSVWFEMKRYFQKGWLLSFDEALNELFEQFPEVLLW